MEKQQDLTAEQVKRIELNRLKAKAIREQRESEYRKNGIPLSRSENSLAGQKRAFSSISDVPQTSRDARNNNSGEPERLRPARNFAKYVEYDFSKMTDTKGGFLTEDDDPHNRALRSANAEEKPAHMTMKEWERFQLLQKLQKEKVGPFEPSISVLEKDRMKKCRECGSMEIDFKWEEIFGCAVCNVCKEEYPDKYSLLTKTEAREDYLLTDPELKDEELLPHMERPNPHKSTWNNMMLYLRFQVEEYAFTQKWGSAEALDAEFERREADKKKRKEAKFKSKLQELRKRTLAEAHQRNRQGKGGNDFGDDLNKDDKHVHDWGRSLPDPETGIEVKTCIECGMKVEELEF